MVGGGGGGGGVMRRIKIPLQHFALKMQGELMREGGYLQDTTVHARVIFIGSYF